MQENNHLLRNEVTQLRTENATLRTENATLRSQIAQHQNLISGLEDQIEVLKITGAQRGFQSTNRKSIYSILYDTFTVPNDVTFQFSSSSSRRFRIYDAFIVASL